MKHWHHATHVITPCNNLLTLCKKRNVATHTIWMETLIVIHGERKNKRNNEKKGYITLDNIDRNQNIHSSHLITFKTIMPYHERWTILFCYTILTETCQGETFFCRTDANKTARWQFEKRCWQNRSCIWINIMKQ
jgi:hypothetical protein